jgi:hypothetical protein
MKLKDRNLLAMMNFRKNLSQIENIKKISQFSQKELNLAFKKQIIIRKCIGKQALFKFQ